MPPRLRRAPTAATPRRAPPAPTTSPRALGWRREHPARAGVRARAVAGRPAAARGPRPPRRHARLPVAVPPRVPARVQAVDPDGARPDRLVDPVHPRLRAVARL